MLNQKINFKKDLQNDNVFVSSELISFSRATGLPTRKGYEQLLVSNGKVVNVVSDSYGHLPNEDFFLKVEEQLINADVFYEVRSINRDDRSFAVDYILNDESYVINVKNGQDKIRPMLRFINSYDGSSKTSGHFGFFREVCSNGLHVAHSQIGFSVRHCGKIAELVLPEIGNLVSKFMDNEFYSLHKKFEVLAERPITDLSDFVKFTAEDLKLFKFESSEKNPDPSLNARLVMDTIRKESNLLGTDPTLWLGYNAFNELLHGKLKKPFDKQKQLDKQLFDRILEFA